MTAEFMSDNRLRPGYRCCASCERIMLVIVGFEPYGSGYRRVCRDCRALGEAMRRWCDDGAA